MKKEPWGRFAGLTPEEVQDLKENKHLKTPDLQPGKLERICARLVKKLWKKKT